MIKKISLYILTIIIGISVVFSNVDTSSGSNVEILVAEVNPLPVLPGADMYVKLNLENNGKSNAQNIILELEESRYFDFKYSNSEFGSSSQNFNLKERIEKISSQGNIQKFYYFKVKPEIKEGEYELIFRISDSNGLSRTKSILVKVEGNPELSLENSKFNKEVITPGDEIELSTELVSVGSGNAKNIRISLDLENFDNLVSLDGNTRFITFLETGNNEEIKFNLKLNNNADLESYNIPIKISAFDENEERSIERIEYIGFNVEGKANLGIANIKANPTIALEGEEVSLSIRIENFGDSQAKSVKAKILNFNGEGIKEAYLGEISSGNDAPAVFNLIPKNNGDITYELELSYEDDFGIKTTKEPLSLFVQQSNSGSNINLVIGVLIILGLVSFFYFKRKK